MAMKPEKRTQVDSVSEVDKFRGWQKQLNSAAKILDELGNLKSTNISVELQELEVMADGKTPSTHPFQNYLFRNPD